MKSRTFFILVFIFLVSLGCFSCKTTATDDFSIDSEIAYCRSQAMRTLVSIPSLDKIPNSMDLDSIKWRYTQVGSWTCGFWPGILWYLYEDTKDNMWREAAGKVTDMIAPLAYRKAKSHDSGFIMMCSLGNGYRLTGKPEYKEGLLHAADSLAMLYNPVVGTILSWPGMVKKENWPHNTIIDNMMNLELLFWAARNGGGQYLYDIACKHAETTMKHQFRKDYSCYHVASQLRRFTLPDSAPIMRRVMGFLSDQARTLIHAGVSRDRICIDPGPGFGKTANEDIVIQRETAKMASLGYPLMCAVSRKRFVGAVSGVTEAAARDAATFGVCLGAIQAGANIVRVHDVAGFAQFLNGYWAVAKPQPRRAFVAVGSNLGHRCDNIRAAREMIAEIPLTCVSNSSKIYESEPAYETRQDAFANAVIEIKTELAPLVLLDELMKIEAELGRDRSKKAKANGPRTIDLDLLWMDGETHGGKKLRLPHPLIGERDFVLVPLEDLMHDPARFFRYNGVEVKEPEDRVGHIVGELGRM